MRYKSNSVAQTQKIAVGLAKKIKNGGVVCFYGDLGAGKTTFVQGLAKGLGIKRRVISPTFVVARRYEYKNNFFYHVDLYRLLDLKEAENIGLEEMWENKNNIVVVEWPEKIQNILPKHISIKIKIISERGREYDIIY